jgi:hypothetical protein
MQCDAAERMAARIFEMETNGYSSNASRAGSSSSDGSIWSISPEAVTR